MLRLALHGSVLAVLVALAGGVSPAADATAFEKLVPARVVRMALARLVPAEIAAVAKRVAAAEKQLGEARPGVSAATLYEVAVRSALGRRDRATLAALRLDERVKADPELARKVAAAQVAAGAGRDPDPEMTVALDKVSPEQFALFRGYLSQIQDAKALADGDALDGLKDYIPAVQELTAAQRTYLGKLVAEARKGVGDQQPLAERLASVRKAREEGAAELAASSDPKLLTSAVAPRGLTGKEPLDPPADPPGKEPATPAAGGGDLPETRGAELAARLATDAAGLLDEGFEGQIDLVKVGKAWARADSVTVADYAILMGKAEALLGREHKHLPARVLFQAALGLTVANGDKATLARLEKTLGGDKAPQFDGREALLAKVTASKGLLGPGRAVPSPFLVPVDQVTAESFAAFRRALDRIETAGRRNDPAALAAVVEGLDATLDLSDDQRKYLVRRAEAVKPDADAPVPVTRALDALAEAGWAGGLPAANRKVLAAVGRDLGKKVGDGTARAVAIRASEAAGLLRLPPFGPTADHVWGREVKPAQALPGDIVQFRDAVFTVPGADAAREWRFAHHTAVIGETAAGTWTVWHQGSGAAGKPAVRRELVAVTDLRPAALTAGSIRIYRPLER